MSFARAPTPRNQKFAVWDLDNCLANDEARLALIKWDQTHPDARYDAYHAAAHKDPVGNRNTFEAINQMARPLFLTSRPEKYRVQTALWLKNNFDLDDAVIFMRPDDDTRSSVDLKRAMLGYGMAAMLRFYGARTCIAAFDDREDIVDMYRQAGLSAAVLRIHDVCAMTPPTGEFK